MAMLDLLTYCYVFANMRYPGEVAAAAAFLADLRTQCVGLVGRVLPGRRTVESSACGCPFDDWTKQGLLCSLERLDAYVSSMA
jgi:hypothetical protein